MILSLKTKFKIVPKSQNCSKSHHFCTVDLGRFEFRREKLGKLVGILKVACYNVCKNCENSR